MNAQRARELGGIAQNLRITGLKMVQSAHSGHIGGAFSLSEIMSVLYFEKMNIRPEDPQWEDRDRFVLSKGHATVALYPTLATRGFFPIEDLSTFRNIDSYLSGHAEMKHVPGVDMSTGSLGQGLSTAVGMALAAKQLGKKYTTYAILGDGEIAEGQIWEAFMFAAAHKLDNLIVILDSNKVQLDGTIEEILNTGDITKKFLSFGFHVISIDGHDVQQIAAAIDGGNATEGKPTIIIANTVKGKGISFMEGKSKWHGKTPNDEEFKIAFEELYNKNLKLEG
ncbi:transketolase [Anaerobacterium chartisolvens]|uniref:Transketolase n=1 Tax=Anaerobacterium chartisolvens TaxID=1297424 RepID=A0A369B3K3_9FIRM|nr:transketolase [Anaerobacterium chartisolvens]RCX16109.1 transketolase [Anaerobacterium chartisolvens]